MAPVVVRKGDVVLHVNDISSLDAIMEVLDKRPHRNDLSDLPCAPSEQVSASVHTSQMIQNKLMDHFKLADFPTLADALKGTRKLMEPALARTLRELSSAASYERHHGG